MDVRRAVDERPERVRLRYPAIAQQKIRCVIPIMPNSASFYSGADISGIAARPKLRQNDGARRTTRLKDPDSDDAAEPTKGF
jgi:hypothetical protein